MSRKEFEIGRLAAAMLILLTAWPAAAAQTPAQDGEFGPVFDLPLIAIHSATLPTGKVLMFSAEHGVPGIHGWLLDPVTLALDNVDPPAPWNPDCSGHSFLPDGRLLVTGGTLSFTPLSGTDLAYTFDPFTEKWEPVESMAGGRWYPTNVTIPDGRVLTMAGLSGTANVQNPDIEVWDPQAGGGWELLGQRILPYYPLLHVLSGGEVFMAGPNAATETYDPATDTWTGVAITNFPGRFEATSVMLTGAPDRIMLVGGFAGFGPPTSSTEIIDLGDMPPSWGGAAHMASARMEHDAVLLPDGSVLVVGGRSDNDASPTPVLAAERYDPQSDSWEVMDSLGVPRMYHSTAILIPDGRVLVAGADGMDSGEIFSPPYLFSGVRPTIVSAPPLLTYGEPFDLEFTSAQGSNAAVLVRNSSVTHSNNMGQRLVDLATFGGGGTVSVPAPTDANSAPPGYYMLFVVDAEGVPSTSRPVRVGPEAGGFVRMGGGSQGAAGIPGLVGTGSLSAGSPATLDLFGAAAGAPAVLFIGFSELNAPLLGGTLVPAPDIVVAGLVTDASGSATLGGVFPSGVAPGFVFWAQFWVEDPAAGFGYSSSNAVAGVTP